MNYYAKEGQIYCSECGRKMVPREGDRPDLGLIETFCPIPEHNRGSWWATSRTQIFCVPVEDEK